MSNENSANQAGPWSGKFVAIGLVAILSAILGLVVLWHGCGRESDDSTSSTAAGRETDDVGYGAELFQIAMDPILHDEQFAGAERMQGAIARLDRWIKHQKPSPQWRLDPFVGRLRQDLLDSAAEAREAASEIGRLPLAENNAQAVKQLDETANLLDGLRARLEELIETTPVDDLAIMVATLQRRIATIQTLADRAETASPEQFATQVKPFLGDLSPQFLEGFAADLDVVADRLDIERLAFGKADGYSFHEAVWLNDVSKWAAGDEFDHPIKPVLRLFDWTVRNIQHSEPLRLSEQTPETLLQEPWETLLFGQGTPVDRARVFTLLARQLNLDAAMLAIVDSSDPDRETLRPWAVGVLIDSEIYVFEPALGLPIPGPGGLTLAQDGGMDIRPATLSQLVEDDSLLRQLDVDEDNLYPLKAADLENVVAMLDVAPQYVSQRMSLVQRELTGVDVVFTLDALAQAQRFAPHVETRRWSFPYRVLFQVKFHLERRRWTQAQTMPFAVPGLRGQPSLWQGRVHHLKGIFVDRQGDPSAELFYQDARPPTLSSQRTAVDPELAWALRIAKMNASYWLGLIAAHKGDTRAAVDFFQTRTLRDFPLGYWTHGARYNLARTHEDSGDYAEAIALYRSDSHAPGHFGAQLRARWLESLVDR